MAEATVHTFKQVNLQLNEVEAYFLLGYLQNLAPEESPESRKYRRELFQLLQNALNPPMPGGVTPN